MNARPAPPKRTRGMMLLEGLVGLLVFSIGILGLLAAQSAATRHSVDVQSRLEARHHITRAIALMRVADPTTVATDFASPSGTQFVAWRDEVTGASGLPGAAATPPTIVFAGMDVTVTVSWKSPGEASGHAVSMTANLD